MKKAEKDTELFSATERHLPHWQAGGSWYFITFRTKNRIQLPHEARNEVLKTIRHDNDNRYDIATAVVMPDHVHIVLKPKLKSENRHYSLSEILMLIKGVSARKINRTMNKTGQLWQDESFDRIIRNEKEWQEKIDYSLNNPVKAGIVDKPEDYRWTFFSEKIY